MQSMKGATSLLGSMNRSMNLPALQRIAMEFEKENDIMDQRQEMMDDAIDDVTGLEDEEEGEEVVREVLDEIGVDLGMAVCGPAWTVFALALAGGGGAGGYWGFCRGHLLMGLRGLDGRNSVGASDEGGVGWQGRGSGWRRRRWWGGDGRR